MNREIKFRAWYKGEMFAHVEHTTFSDGSNGVTALANGILFSPNSNEVTLMQFTGKLGHNDRELYEGDIVFYEEAGDEGDERHWLVIVWIPEWSMFASVFIDEYLKFLEKGAEALDEVMFWTYTLSENYHYAGNIYENPELLKS